MTTEKAPLPPYSYTVKKYQADLSATAYLKHYRRAEYFIQFCRQCVNYNRRYGCPPFAEDLVSSIASFQNVRIIGVKIIPDEAKIPLKEAPILMEPVTRVLNEELLELERSLGGVAFGFVGSCPYCMGKPCARIDGKPCRHPQKVRPSLEAIGFDMGKTATELLGLEIKWSHGDYIPEYLTLVCGVFYG